MNIRVLRSARLTIAEGIRFYDRQEHGLGGYSLNSIMSDLRSLKIYAVLDDRRDPKRIKDVLRNLGLKS